MSRCCQQTVECLPKRIVADGDYTNHASVQAAEVFEGQFLWFLGMTAGNRASMTPTVAVESLLVASFRTTLSTTSTFVPLANDLLFML